MVLELYLHIIMVLEFEQTERIKIVHDSFRIYNTKLKFEPYRMKFDREKLTGSSYCGLPNFTFTKTNEKEGNNAIPTVVI